MRAQQRAEVVAHIALCCITGRVQRSSVRTLPKGAVGQSDRKETTMFHQIEFCWAVFADVERPDYAFMQRMVIKCGDRFAARRKPYVAESANGPVEVADLYLEDGTIVKEVRYAAFRFLDGVKGLKR